MSRRNDPSTSFLVVDGRQGEGGGQLLRTSLSLSALTGRPFRLIHIRAGRSKPGLRPQHLTAVRAVAAICDAQLDGDRLNSQTLEFRPQSLPRSGDYRFDVGDAAATTSAGAVTLIFQAILWPLLFATGTSRATLVGGTHVPFSPPFHYLEHVARPAFTRLGADMTLALERYGWIQAGQGRMTAVIQPTRRLQAVDFRPRPAEFVQGVAAVTNLPAHIPQRMARRADNLLRERGLRAAIQPVRETSAGPGAGLVLWLPGGGFSSLGRPGLPADKVAEAAVAELLAFIDNGAAVDAHLADQLMLPLALAHGQATYTTNQITRHTLTNAGLLQQWLDVAIHVDGDLDQPGSVTIEGVGWAMNEEK